MPAQSLAPPAKAVDPVRKWRFDELLRAGYPRREATLLSGVREVDLHEAVRLLEDGCPVETALRILL